jgi:hypothetical protein
MKTNKELEMTRRKAIVAYFIKLYPGIRLEGLRNNTKYLNRETWCLGRDSSWTSFEYKSEAVPLEPFSAVRNGMILRAD